MTPTPPTPPTPSTPLALANATPRPGAIWRLVPPDDPGASRLVLVVAPSHPGRVQVVPLHPFVAYAGPEDLVVPSDITGLTYALVVHGDMRCTARTAMLEHCIATVPAWVLDAYHAPQADLVGGLGRGAPLRGIFDARLDFKRGELATLGWQYVPQ